MPRPTQWLFTAVIALACVLATVGGVALAQDDLAKGRETYVKVCAECHGDEGRGDGETARRLGFRPRDFTLGAFKCRSTPTGSPPTARDLTRVIGQGLPGTSMRGLASKIPPEEMADLVAYVQTLIPSSGADPVELDIPEPPGSTEASQAAGAAIYGLLRCWNCHGVDGRGKGPAAASLKDAWGEAIRVYDFTARRRYKCGGSDEDLYRTLHTGLTGSPMPSFTTAFAFAADQVGDPGSLEEILGAETVQMIRDWLANQPTSNEVDGLSDTERRELVDRRTWQLVSYLRSLER